MLGTPLPLEHLSLVMLDIDVPIASDLLASMEVIHLIESQQDEILGDFPGKAYQSAYRRLDKHLKKISPYLDRRVVVERRAAPVALDELDRADKRAQSLWKRVSSYEEKIRAAREKIQHHKQLSNSLTQFENLDFDLGWLSADNPFLKFLVGTVPHAELSQLERALSLANTVIEPFQKSQEHDYIFVATEKEHQQDTEEILKAANFYELTIPPELHSHPEKIKADIQHQLKKNQGLIDQYSEALHQLIQSQHEEICEIIAILNMASPFATVASNLTGKGQLVLLEGWVAASRKQEIDKQLGLKLCNPYLLTFRPPSIDEMSRVPSLQKHARLLSPFQRLVEQFGVPRYGEIDPTKLFAFSYTLMFGMMFGDIGHGASIILIGILFRKKIVGLQTFAGFAGLSSILFGTLYGSVFGYEDIIHPLWMSPMEAPTQMLLIALAWGVSFLMIVNLLSIVNLLALNKRAEAYFGGNGVAGLIFYWGGIYGAYQYVANQQFALVEMVGLLLPLSVILYHQWQTLEGRMAEKILITVIEGIEKVINRLSSTLSFLRVAAFSLNHVALAAAIFTLAGMMDNTGYNITLLLGNLFIIVLEGGIVAIQCLRLEYYEGFSRFFSGKGERFTPLKIETH